MYKRKNLNNLIAKANYKNADLKNSNILIRSCLNVPLKNQKIQDSTRADQALPLIKKLAPICKRLIITGHLGRPKGKKVDKLSLNPVANYLENKIGETVNLIATDELDKLTNMAKDYEKDKRVFLIENIRFFPEEKSKKKQDRKLLAEKLAEYADIYINDAFPDIKPKKKTASTYEIAEILPSYLGPKLIEEINSLNKLSNPNKPFVTVMGGAKLSDKLEAMSSLIKLVDKIIVGGAMAYTLMKAEGTQIGNSLLDNDSLDLAKKMLQEYGEKIILPIDHVVLDKFEEPKNDSKYVTTTDQNIPDANIAVDIGPKTRKLFIQEIEKAKTILWNGPMGVFEWNKTGIGTKEIGQTIGHSKAYTIAGGGDSIAAINKYNLIGFDHICMGGGAMLSFFSSNNFDTLDIIFDNFE